MDRDVANREQASLLRDRAQRESSHGFGPGPIPKRQLDEAPERLFAEAGAFVFGSGLAIVPFLYGGVVERFHWLTDRQSLDAVAVAMITPGPVVITVAFIGYLVAGPLGAVAAAIGTFVPCYVFTVVPAPYFRRYSQNHRIKAFVSGVTAAATGAIAGALSFSVVELSSTCPRCSSAPRHWRRSRR